MIENGAARSENGVVTSSAWSRKDPPWDRRKQIGPAFRVA
jgi:hypothetical protein